MPVSAKRRFHKREHPKRPPVEKVSFFRRKHTDPRWKPLKKIGFWSWSAGLTLVACLLLGLSCLLLSYANFSGDIFSGYFEMPMIALVNLLIPIALCFFLYAIIGKSWIAYLLTLLPCLAVAIANYYLILIRNDPLQWEDVSCLREALAITGTQKYEFEIGWRVIVAVLVPLSCTVGLFFFARFVPRRWERLAAVLFCTLLLLGTVTVVSHDGIYSVYTKNYKHINTWSTTQIYCSRGVLYSFSRSAMSSMAPAPQGYSKAAAQAELNRYPEKDIPQDKKVNVLAIMRESYSDLSDLPSTEGAIDWSCYDLYHALAAESYTGTLVTNGFGGNTKDAERAFLTGSSNLITYRKPANSYLWYLRQQGYTAEGAHPFYGWFYNRQNVNKYLGFENYYFQENLFGDLVGKKTIAHDDVVLEQVWRLFDESDPTQPYFGFHVTYEGHGPYNYQRNIYDTQYVLTDPKTPEGYSMNNYLSCIQKRDRELMRLIEKLRASERPVVLLIYGDHNATLGSDINNYTTAAYSHYGIDMDPTSAQGFLNYYSTEYLIWANDAAKAQLGTDLVGKGPTVSPCYLMNVLFDALGWDAGPSYLLAMREQMDRFPIVSTRGQTAVYGQLVSTIPEEAAEQYWLMRYMEYYWKTSFRYADMK